MKSWLITAGVVLVLGFGLYLLTRPDRVEVTLVSVERGDVEETVANTRAGTIEACQRSKLSLPIGGQIDEILVAEGDHVSKDQLLITLWNKDRKARVNEARAAVKSAQMERESLCIAARSDTREARRLTGLAGQKLIAEDVADLAQAKAEGSVARCDAGKAREQQAEAALEVASALYQQTELRAPFDGIIAEVTGKIGEYATPSPPGVPTPPAIDLITDDCHYISAPLDEVDAAKIRVGMPVRVTMDAYRDRDFPATVSRIAPYVLDLEKQARTVEVEARFTELETDAPLLTGYSADMEIILQTREDSLRVPSELILDNRFVMALDSDDTLIKKPVSTGISNWRYTEIVSGLSAGEKVVANIGATGVVEGAPAEVVEGEADGAD